ncbi:MAG: hypothetical protein H6650_05200 [Ardenticatenales bacterium]|nr:hypothetical protein [Ardenticatenales bacterium]
MTNDILEQLPEELRKQSIDLSITMGVNSLAWYSSLIPQIVRWCWENDVAILGGDVLELDKDGQLSYTYDNWYINFDSKLIWRDFVAKSLEYAVQNVQSYEKLLLPKALVFDLVFHTQ